MRKLVCLLFFFAATAIASFAQTAIELTGYGAVTSFTSLATFDVANGAHPIYAGVVQGVDGNLYGTATQGGAHNHGTVYRITRDGELTLLYSFCADTGCPDGETPYASLVQGNDGNLYGTTEAGGAYGYGTVFKISLSGALTVLHSFDLTDGAHPYAALLQASDGNFYGTTHDGGTSITCPAGCGTFFRITAGGVFTNLHSFRVTEAAYSFSGLTEAADGNFYGTAAYGTAAGKVFYNCKNGCGTVFRVTPCGLVTVLYSFSDFSDNPAGDTPFSVLVHATDGSFYGTTTGGGGPQGGGTVFKITRTGELTTLYAFNSSTDFLNGASSYGGLVQATDGNFYGTTYEGADNSGTIFRITPEGTLTALHLFETSVGSNPLAAMIQSTDGNFYGTTYSGGDPHIGYYGTVYRLSMGFGRFVEALTNLAKVGVNTVFLGQNLAGTTQVSFNGVDAAFSVVSDTEIKATVPAGATTGFVTVTTPDGTLKSNKKFVVLD
jgi:uncharacterized repeat protein (TIGR03803 family)